LQFAGNSPYALSARGVQRRRQYFSLATQVGNVAASLFCIAVARAATALGASKLVTHNLLHHGGIFPRLAVSSLKRRSPLARFSLNRLDAETLVLHAILAGRLAIAKQTSPPKIGRLGTKRLQGGIADK
jgi:hypothetical protein